LQKLTKVPLLTFTVIDVLLYFLLHCDQLMFIAVLTKIIGWGWHVMLYVQYSVSSVWPSKHK